MFGRMAQENARHSFTENGEERNKAKTIETLRRALYLRNAPKRIECFDISNIQGDLAVGSMVALTKGARQKSLSSVSHQDSGGRG
jgi:excinuclease ABC subunit C